MVSIQYLEGKSFAGSREHYACGLSISGESYSAYWPHTAFFCPLCGEIWGRAIYTYHFEYSPIPQNPWVIENRRCVKHGDGQFLCGNDILTDCSDDLLTRELLALIERAEHEATSA